jgi:hypothetical protein
VIDLSIAALVVGAVIYGTSAASKLRGPAAYRAYREGLGETRLAPERWLSPVAAALAAAEAVTAVLAATGAGLLAVHRGPEVATVALGAAALLAALLTVGVAVVVRRGTRARCACFGATTVRQIGGAHLIRNGTLLAALAAGLAAMPIPAGRPAAAGVVLALAAAGTASLVLVRLDDIVDLFQAPTAPTGRQTP